MSSSIIKDSLSSLLSTSLKLASIPIAILLLVSSILLLGALKRFFTAKLGLDLYAHIPSVKTTSKYSLLFGDLGTVRKEKPAKAHLKWQKELDSEVYVYRGMLYNHRLLLADSVAMNFILGSNQAYDFPKPTATRNFLRELLGDGLLTVEGECGWTTPRWNECPLL